MNWPGSALANAYSGSVRFARQTRSRGTDCDAEGLGKVSAAVSIDVSTFVEKVSGSRPGCP
jgi:hypothetical protein